MSRASVVVEGRTVGAIDRPGLLVLVGITHDDTAAIATTMAEKKTYRVLGAQMEVGLVNDGPVTILLDSAS